MILNFAEKIKRASLYKNANFFQENIGIIARGPSVSRLDLCYDKFNCCFLSGEFNHSFDRIGKYLFGKEIVLCIMQNGRYRTPIDMCEKYNIKDIQVGFQSNTDDYKKCKKLYPDLNVYGLGKDHYETINKVCKDREIYTTGMASILYSLYFNPKRIYITGIDFYDRLVKPYFVKEDHDLLYENSMKESVKKIRKNMIEMLEKIRGCFLNTEFYLYTTYEGIKSVDNLFVKYV